MLLVIAIILALVWAICLFLWHLTGGWVYILLFLAVVVLIVHFMTARKR